jgi:uncharacterized membrane protein
MHDESSMDRRFRAALGAAVSVSAVLLALGLSLWMAGRAATAVIHAGLIVLMCTPALRVTAALIEFVRRREWTYAAATLAVIALLATSTIVALTLPDRAP